MKCVPTLAHDPVPNAMPAELSQPRFPNLDTLVEECDQRHRPLLERLLHTQAPRKCARTRATHRSKSNVASDNKALAATHQSYFARKKSISMLHVWRGLVLALRLH